MKTQPNFAFRNYLLKLVPPTQGIITYTDFPKINEDHKNPKNQIVSLTHILEDLQDSSFSGNTHSEIATRLFHSWQQSRLESLLKSLVSIQSLHNSRARFHYFFKWLLNKPPRGKTRSVEFGSDIKPPSAIKHSPKISQFSYGSASELKHVLAGPSYSYQQIRHSSASFYDKEETQSLYDRLYQDAAIKKAELEKIRAEGKDKDLEECTFKPEISESNTKSLVYERLSFADMKEKEELLKQQREQKELEGCTFRPKTNSVVSISRDRSYSPDKNFNKLYQNAEMLRQKIRDKELLQKEKELDDCTFRPAVLKPSKGNSGDVYEKLYQKYQESQRTKRNKELEKKNQETDEKNFVPKLVTPKKESLTPVYTRLYEEMEKRKEKMKKRVEKTERVEKLERERSSSAKKAKGKEDGVPRFESLYAISKSASQRKVMLEEKVRKETGVSFRPDISKSSPRKNK